MSVIISVFIFLTTNYHEKLNRERWTTKTEPRKARKKRRTRKM